MKRIWPVVAAAPEAGERANRLLIRDLSRSVDNPSAYLLLKVPLLLPI